MERSISPEDRERITNCGALGYDEKRTDMVLGWEASQHPDFSALFEKGKAKGEYVIDLKLFEMAQAGDLKAMDKLDTRKRRRGK